MTTLPVPRDQWLVAVRTHAARLDEQLHALGRRAHDAGVAGEPLVLGAVAEAQAAVEELQVAEEELRVQGDHLAEAEGALDHERRRYQELFDFAPDALLLTDARGVIREANRAVSGLVGYARAYIVGKPITAVVHPDSAAKLATALERLRAAPDDVTHAWSMRLKGRRSGPPRDVAVRVAPVRGEDGIVAGMRWSLRDVTDELARLMTLANIRAENERDVRARTMELLAVTRMQSATIADHEKVNAALARVLVDAGRSLQHGAECRALITNVLESFASALRARPTDTERGKDAPTN